MTESHTVDIFRIQFIAILVSVIMMIVIFELIRRNRLREKYSLIWFAACIVMMIFSAWRDLLDLTAVTLGVAYAPALLFMVALFFVFVLLIHFSIVISDLAEKTKILAQEVAILKKEIQDAKKNNQNN
jgi:hypothetical protein